jgi:type I restriction-modification system DNA methylase subunit
MPVQGETQRLWSSLRANGIVSPIHGLDVVAPLVLLKWGAGEREWKRLTLADEAGCRDFLMRGARPLLRDIAAQRGHRWESSGSELRALPSIKDLVGKVDAIWTSDRGSYGATYDALLEIAARDGATGWYSQPARLVDTLVSAIAPAPRERVLDPAAGAGQFLVAAGLAGGDRVGILGFERDPALVRIATTRLLLHGIRNTTLRDIDALRGEIPIPSVEVVVSSPPFGGKADLRETPSWTGLKTARSELHYLEVARRCVGIGGRAAVVVPQSVLFGTSAAHLETRRRLVEDQRLVAVVTLPGRLFASPGQLQAAVLWFADGPTAERTWFTEPATLPRAFAALTLAGQMVKEDLSTPPHPLWWNATRERIAQHDYVLLPSMHRDLDKSDSTEETIDELLDQLIVGERRLLDLLEDLRGSLRHG